MISLSVHALVGMLLSLEGTNWSELRCGSHVGRLLSKLPVQYRDRFVEHCINRGILTRQTTKTYSLLDLFKMATVKIDSQAHIRDGCRA